MELTLIFGAAVVVAFLAGWKGIGLASSAKKSYSLRALSPTPRSWWRSIMPRSPRITPLWR